MFQIIRITSVSESVSYFGVDTDYYDCVDAMKSIHSRLQTACRTEIDFVSDDVIVCHNKGTTSSIVFKIAKQDIAINL